MDKYVYPGTSVLKNKRNIRNKNDLFLVEAIMTEKRLFELQEKPVPGKFDYAHLKKIHGYIFQDLYDWAGKPRTVNIGKGNIFCLPEHLESYAALAFKNCREKCETAKTDKETFAKTVTGYYADINALHPFREGNGRAQREFIRELCTSCGWGFDLSHATHEEMLAASVESFYGAPVKLEKIIYSALRPPDNGNNSSRLHILSKNDLSKETLGFDLEEEKKKILSGLSLPDDHPVPKQDEYSL